MPKVGKIRSLNLPDHQGPAQACSWKTLHFLPWTEQTQVKQSLQVVPHSDNTKFFRNSVSGFGDHYEQSVGWKVIKCSVFIYQFCPQLQSCEPVLFVIACTYIIHVPDKIFTTFDTHLYFSHASVVLNSSMKCKLCNSLLLCAALYYTFICLMADCSAGCSPSCEFLVTLWTRRRLQCFLFLMFLHTAYYEWRFWLFLVAPDKHKSCALKVWS